MLTGNTMPQGLCKALGQAADALCFGEEKDSPLWLLGGSCGLLLQDVPLAAPPRDIDLYADLEAVDRLHSALGRYACGKPAEDWSRGCYSLIGHYRLEDYHLELVCGFRICSGPSKYNVETCLLQAGAPAGNYSGVGRLRLMPLAHEFVFNVLRGRRDRYEAIASVMRRNLPAHLPLLQTLIRRNSLEIAHIGLLGELLGVSALCS
ncbi:hypothetical protein J2Z22_002364 [Paenibacillus forsythiae]|uniref:Nucleotidyltransferase family protein n=1 Tax=Paenibacillus forsythiae TaxID=365616 RepID=A0ABU3H7W8_9BACL|nr:hypothetical protein [Paenibacillus forsythiae]MDT3426830.1 hypothetical protein [Paenibacillus forsythiae]